VSVRRGASPRARYRRVVLAALLLLLDPALLLLDPGLLFLDPVPVLLDPAAARAHPANVAYARIAIEPRQVEVALSANLFELDLLLSLDRNLDGRVEVDELEARRAEILDYLRRTVVVSASGANLPLEALPFAISHGRDGKPLFEVTLRFRSANPLQGLAIRCEPLTELGADHVTLATIIRMEEDARAATDSRAGADRAGEVTTARGAAKEFAFHKGVVYREGDEGWARTVEFLRLGILHIFIGYDHIAFLVGLLLIGGRLWTIIKVVTAFTVAHSVTLTLAALDVVTPNASVVEAGIALSIVYVAAENLFFARGDRHELRSGDGRRGLRSVEGTRRWFLSAGSDRRWLVSFAFGLVHGFGFASVLKEMDLPRSGLVTALFSFNLGVEVGQLAIVLLVVPALWLLRCVPVYHAMTRTASVIILSLGLLWLYQRVLG
jgi:hydrogenase/urease accessory protein HupE